MWYFYLKLLVNQLIRKKKFLPGMYQVSEYSYYQFEHNPSAHTQIIIQHKVSLAIAVANKDFPKYSFLSVICGKYTHKKHILQKDI